MHCCRRASGSTSNLSVAAALPLCCWLQALADMLVEVCKNPKSPGFNHYLFESVAALIKHGAAADKAQLATYEATLFPAFDIVLSNDVQVRPSTHCCLQHGLQSVRQSVAGKLGAHVVATSLVGTACPTGSRMTRGFC